MEGGVNQQVHSLERASREPPSTSRKGHRLRRCQTPPAFSASASLTMSSAAGRPTRPPALSACVKRTLSLLNDVRATPPAMSAVEWRVALSQPERSPNHEHTREPSRIQSDVAGPYLLFVIGIHKNLRSHGVHPVAMPNSIRRRPFLFKPSEVPPAASIPRSPPSPPLPSRLIPPPTATLRSPSAGTLPPTAPTDLQDQRRVP